MPTTIESLELEVKSSATSATSGIDALSASLSKLKNAIKGGVGLTSVISQLNSLNTALNGVDSVSTGKIDTLSNSLSKLSSLGSLKLSSSIGNQLRNIGGAATALNGVDFSGITNLSNALSSLSSLGKSNLNSFITQLGKLPQLAQTLADMNITQFTAQIQQLSDAIAPLASQLNTVATAFSRLPTNINRVVTATNTMTRTNNIASKSYINLWAKVRMARSAVSGFARIMGSWITESNNYIENLNLFKVSMGEYASEARKYAEQVGEIMGIDPSEWMRNQGVFMTLATGFGVASDKAYIMSKNLTQLGYDMSSFFNMSYADSMQKLQSALAGELEPVRRVGYDLSQNALKEIILDADNYAASIENIADAMSDSAMASYAAANGYTKEYTEMTQAEKSQLRYIALMKQVTVVQGDMARTLNAPANQIRVMKAQLTQLSRALGNVFIPVLNKVLPYMIAVLKVLTRLVNHIASLAGFEIPEVDYSGVSSATDAIGSLTDEESEATIAAKKLKNALLGIDELNVIDNSDASDSAYVSGGDLGFELPDFDKFLSGAVNEKVDEITKKIEPFFEKVKKDLNEIFASVMAIGSAFITWKIAKGVIVALRWLTRMKNVAAIVSVGFKIAGLGFFLDSWNTIKEVILDIQENEPNFANVTKLISGFAEGLAAAFLMFGRIDLAAPMMIISGISGMVSSINEMVKDGGVNWDKAIDFTKYLGLFLTGIGLAFKGLRQYAGIGLILSGVSLILENVKDLVNGFKTGDFSNVEWIEVAAGALMLIGGLILVIKKFGEVSKIGKQGKAKSAIDAVKTSTNGVSGSVGKLSKTLTSLAKNLALGLVIIAEVAVAALLITGAIILIGKALEQVGIAWKPVINNGGEIAVAMGIGIGFLVTIGIVTAALGTVGAPLIASIALGVVVLAELGIAAGLFLGEIWVIGKLLTEIGKAWQPVLDNGETIAIGIGIGTGLLVGIGVVAAALGVVTIASGASLPIAIGIGADLLKKLADAFVKFTGSLVTVADELSNKLHPSLENMNGKLPTLSDNMGRFVHFMTEFAGQVVTFTKASVVSGLSATVDTIVGWFTKDPIEKLEKDVSTVYAQTSSLNEKLVSAVSELKLAIEYLAEYQKLLTEIEHITGDNANISVSSGVFENMKDVGQNAVLGFVGGVKDLYGKCKDTVTSMGSSVVGWFKNVLGINSPSKVFYEMGEFSVDGYNNAISKVGKDTKGAVSNWAESFTDVSPMMAFAVDTSAIQSFDPSKVYGSTLSTEVQGSYQMTSDGFVEGMEVFYREYVEPTLNRMADDVRRQADKEEQTIVQVGNRTVNDAVSIQRNANGYAFAT